VFLSFSHLLWRHQPASPNVLDLLALLGFSVYVIIDSRFLLMAVGIRADILIANFEADVISVIAIRLYP
jgi:hypothetical protein